MIWRLVAPYMIGALALGALAGVGWGWWQSVTVERLKADNAALARSVAALTEEKELAKLSRDVARAEAERFRAKAEQFDELRESILRGEEDAPIPDWFADILAQLRGAGARDRDAASRP